MAVSIELRPELEERLQEEARALGVPVETYIERVLLDHVPLPVNPHRSSLREFEAAMDELSEGSEDRPVLPAEAFSRENIYRREGETGGD